MRKARKTERKTRTIHALISVIIMAILMFVCIVLFSSEPQIPLILGCLAAGIIAAVIGYSWEEILKGMIDGISQALEAILILLLIGVLVGLWIASGTVPTMIYYGLKVINADFFLPASMAISTLVALAIGSWGTVGTIGIALLGIGVALGLPLPLVAGSIISGAYLGEIVSPLSDATNLCAAVVARDVFSVVKAVAPIAFISFAVAMLAYLGIGLFEGVTSSEIVEADSLLQGIEAEFVISPLSLLPMVIMIVCIIAKVPAIIAMLIGALSAAVIAVPLQSVDLASLVTFAHSGYVSETGIIVIDTLLTAGGLFSMMNTISIVIIAMAFGGVMKCSGQMEALIRPIVAKIRGFGALNAFVEVSCIFSNVILPDQYLGISVPGQMFADAYDARFINRTRLGTALLAGGAVSSPLIPWNTCGIYCMGLLGVGAIAYAPFCFMNIACIVISLIAGFIIAGKVKRKAQAAQTASASSSETLQA